MKILEFTENDRNPVLDKICYGFVTAYNAIFNMSQDVRYGKATREEFVAKFNGKDLDSEWDYTYKVCMDDDVRIVFHIVPYESFYSKTYDIDGDIILYYKNEEPQVIETDSAFDLYEHNFVVKMNEREKHLLWLVLQQTINWYLRVIAAENGAAKAKYHISLSCLIAHYLTAQGGEGCLHDKEELWPVGAMRIHNYMAREFTDNLDKNIGFPMDHKPYAEEFDRMTKKFFDWIVKHINDFNYLVMTTREVDPRDEL
jgi:hypothetical protein